MDFSFHPSATCLFRPCGSSCAEARLLFKEKTPEVPAEAPKEKAEKPKGDTAEKVKKETDKTGADVKKVVPQAAEPAPVAPEIPREGPHYVGLPSLSEAIRDTRNAFATALATAFAPVAIPAFAGIGAARYAGSKFTKNPVSLGQELKDTFITAPTEGFKSVLRAIKFLPHWAGAAGLNTLKFTGDRLRRVLRTMIAEPFHEISGLISGKIAEGKEKGFHPITGIFKLGKGALFDIPINVAKWYGGMWKHHWKGMLIAHAFGPAIYQSVSIPGIAGAVTDFWDVFMNILKGVTTKAP